MATKSLLKNIDVKDKKFGYSLLNALENSQNKKSKIVLFQRSCREIKGEEIKRIFGDK